MTTDPVHRAEAALPACQDRIYAFVTLPARSTGTHVLEGRWYRPDGGQQEYTRVALELPPPGGDSVHMWLQVIRAEDVVDALFTRRDEDDRFDGRWTLDVFWDRRKVATRRFRMRCG